MLRKLLKYDLRANMKIYLFVWPALVVLAAINRIGLTVELKGTVGNVFVATSTTLFVLAVVVANVLAVVISVARYYSGLLKQEGYLMFTLPVKPWQLILSKLLTAILTIAVTAGLSFVCCFVVFEGVDGLIDTIKFIWGQMDIDNSLTLVLFGLMMLVALCDFILQVYAACAIGHQFKKHRVLMSVVAYYAINVAIEVIAVTAVSVLLSRLGADIIELDISMNGMLAIVLACQTLMGVVFFFASERLLRTRLNLE